MCRPSETAPRRAHCAFPAIAAAAPGRSDRLLKEWNRQSVLKCAGVVAPSSRFDTRQNKATGQSNVATGFARLSGPAAGRLPAGRLRLHGDRRATAAQFRERATHVVLPIRKMRPDRGDQQIAATTHCLARAIHPNEPQCAGVPPQAWLFSVTMGRDDG